MQTFNHARNEYSPNARVLECRINPIGKHSIEYMLFTWGTNGNNAGTNYTITCQIRINYDYQDPTGRVRRLDNEMIASIKPRLNRSWRYYLGKEKWEDKEERYLLNSPVQLEFFQMWFEKPNATRDRFLKMFDSIDGWIKMNMHFYRRLYEEKEEIKIDNVLFGFRTTMPKWDKLTPYGSAQP